MRGKDCGTSVANKETLKMADRMKVWKALQEPKMSWETFKRMLPVFDGDADKALREWRTKQIGDPETES